MFTVKRVYDPASRSDGTRLFRFVLRLTVVTSTRVREDLAPLLP